jgi:hypothetical protein
MRDAHSGRTIIAEWIPGGLDRRVEDGPRPNWGCRQSRQSDAPNGILAFQSTSQHPECMPRPTTPAPGQHHHFFSSSWSVLAREASDAGPGHDHDGEKRLPEPRLGKSEMSELINPTVCSLISLPISFSLHFNPFPLIFHIVDFDFSSPLTL